MQSILLILCSQEDFYYECIYRDRAQNQAQPQHNEHLRDQERSTMRSGDEMNNEIKLVYQAFRIDGWQEVSEDVYKTVALGFKRILYHAADYESLQKANAELLQEENISNAVIEKLSMALSEIAITIKGEEDALKLHSYHDVSKLVSVLHLENELNKVQMEEMLTAMRRAVLALAFAAESSAAMRDDYNALSASIDKVVAANKGEKS